MPSRWNILLNGPCEVAVPIAAPHAVVSRWLDDDHAARVKGYALNPPQPVPGGLSWEIRLLDDGLEERLRTSASEGAPVRLGRHQFAIAQAPAPAEYESWKDLAVPSGNRAWQLSFDTPVSFRKGDRSSPLPAPGSLIHGLADRWRYLDPASAPDLKAKDAAALWVSDLEGHSVALTLQGRIVSGFLGRVRLVVDHGTQNDALADAADSLFRFAAFAGAGSFTALGFGVVRSASTWQPRTPA